MSVSRTFSLLARNSRFISSFQSVKGNYSTAAVAEKPEENRKVTVLPGDGVGPEVFEAVQNILVAGGAGSLVDWEKHGLSETTDHGDSAFKHVTESLTRNHVALNCHMTAASHSTDGQLMSLSLKLRKELDLFANVVHTKSLPGVVTRHTEPIDLVIIREQTEGEYSAKEHETVPGVVECLKIITREKSRRIATFAFEYAEKHGRKKVTLVHKANIMKLSDGLFLATATEVSKNYPNIEFDSVIVDNCAMQIVSHPHQYDILLTPNLYGDIVANLATALVGGPGLVAGQSHSDTIAVFEPGTRHTFKSGVGRGVANPTALLLAAINMLEHLGADSVAETIKKGLYKTLNERKVKTKDLGGHSSTMQFTNEVIKNMKSIE